MRFGSLAPACIVLAASVVTASADYHTKTPSPDVAKELKVAPKRIVRSSRILSFRSIASQIDNQVVANLLADAPSHANDLPLTAMAGEVARCESRTCQVPLTIRVDDAQGPITLTLAVANPKGELSEIQHVECVTGDCSVSLILERGKNTISVGVLDGIAQATAFTTMRVNATRTLADRGKTEWF